MALLSLHACAPPAEPEPLAIARDGGTVARGYGVSFRGVAYIPDDRVHSFALVESCESGDGPTCGDYIWRAAEQDALARAAEYLGAISGFETRFATTDPEVRVHAHRDTAPAPACSSGATTCWFGATICSEPGGVLLDAAGVPLVDGGLDRSRSIARCKRWALELSLANIYAWADFLHLDPLHVLRSAALHEMGHTLGLAHHRAGLMRALMPVCYFIDPGDPRDAFDPEAPADAFQRFQCVEGVGAPALAPAQRAKLDSYQASGAGWALVTPSAEHSRAPARPAFGLR